MFSDEEKLEILNHNTTYNTYRQIIEPHYNTFDKKKKNASFIERMIYLELKHRLPELLLMRVDKMAMAKSVETRVPYLDQKLVEFALGIPTNLKYKNGTTKYILKEALGDLLPPDVVRRPKEGFVMPLNKWMTKKMLPFIKETLSPPIFRKLGHLLSC